MGKQVVSSNRIFLPGNRYLIAFLTFLSAFPPITTDMYLPALPHMAVNLDASEEMISLSLTTFFFVYAFSTIIWGPLSDRYGRKPILFTGSILYIFSSFGITLCDSISTLLILRSIQAFGCGAATAVSLAIVKDVLRGKLMERIVSFMQAAHILAPLSAPVLGGMLLWIVDWRGIFWCLVFCGFLGLAGCFCLSETGRNTNAQTLPGTFKRMGVVLTNKKFRDRFLIFSANAMPFMSFLAVSAFIYQSWFGLSPQAFSFFFALNALFSLVGPFAHLYVFSKMNRKTAISLLLFTMAIFGGMILLFGSLNPWLFAMFMAPITFCGSALRPPATVLMMQAVKGDNGVVSALIQFGAMSFASLAMLIAPMAFWPNPTMAVGTISLVVSAICFLYWQKVGNNQNNG